MRAASAAWDVLVVGGGPAGLSAALVLGPMPAPVLVCDAGPKRNRASRALHGFLSRDGIAPAALLAERARAAAPIRDGAPAPGARRAICGGAAGCFEATLVGRPAGDARAACCSRPASSTSCHAGRGSPASTAAASSIARTATRGSFATAGSPRGVRRARRRPCPEAAPRGAGASSLLTGGAYRAVRQALARDARRAGRATCASSRSSACGGRGGAARRAWSSPAAASVACDALFLTVGRRQACDLFGRLGCRLRPRRARSPRIAAGGRACAASSPRATPPSTPSWSWSRRPRARAPPSPSTRSCWRRSWRRNRAARLDLTDATTFTVPGSFGPRSRFQDWRGQEARVHAAGCPLPLSGPPRPLRATPSGCARSARS